MLRTYPAIRPQTPYAPHGERSVARGYGKAFRRARRLMYLEDQYMWSPHIARLLADALRANPELHVVVVVPRHPDVDGRFALPPNEVGRLQAIRGRAARPPRTACTCSTWRTHAGTPVYVHAKVCVIDDVWAVRGQRQPQPALVEPRQRAVVRGAGRHAGRRGSRATRRGSATAPAASPATCG